MYFTDIYVIFLDKEHICLECNYYWISHILMTRFQDMCMNLTYLP